MRQYIMAMNITEIKAEASVIEKGEGGYVSPVDIYYLYHSPCKIYLKLATAPLPYYRT